MAHMKKKKRENDAYKLHMSHYMPPTVLFMYDLMD